MDHLSLLGQKGGCDDRRKPPGKDSVSEACAASGSGFLEIPEEVPFPVGPSSLRPGHRKEPLLPAPLSCQNLPNRGGRRLLIEEEDKGPFPVLQKAGEGTGGIKPHPVSAARKLAGFPDFGFEAGTLAFKLLHGPSGLGTIGHKGHKAPGSQAGGGLDQLFEGLPLQDPHGQIEGPLPHSVPTSRGRFVGKVDQQGREAPHPSQKDLVRAVGIHETEKIPPLGSETFGEMAREERAWFKEPPLRVIPDPVLSGDPEKDRPAHRILRFPMPARSLKDRLDLGKKPSIPTRLACRSLSRNLGIAFEHFPLLPA